MSLLPNHAELTALLTRIGMQEDASSFHGILCGALCRLGPDRIDPQSLMDDDVPPLDADGRQAFSQLVDATVESLCDAEMGFMPLLPEDETGLAVRASALSAWCEGFLYGLSGQVQLDLTACSDEVREIISDLSQFTRAGLAENDDLEVEEDAYAELVEYVRVGAQLIYMELRPRGGFGDDIPPTLH